MRLIGINGYINAGKDTVGETLMQQGYRRIAFADPVKDAALILNPYILPVKRYLTDYVLEFGWEAAKTIPWVRNFLQKLGTECGRDIHGQDCWIKKAIEKVLPIAENEVDPAIVITDVRFDNEARWIQENGGEVWQLRKDSLEPATLQHRSEHLVKNPDVIIYNDGTLEELRDTVHDYLEEYENAAL